jgi:DNA phosphorothioation-dependent restriction protein DptG
MKEKQQQIQWQPEARKWLDAARRKSQNKGRGRLFKGLWQHLADNKLTPDAAGKPLDRTQVQNFIKNHGKAFKEQEVLGKALDMVLEDATALPSQAPQPGPIALKVGRNRWRTIRTLTEELEQLRGA